MENKKKKPLKNHLQKFQLLTLIKKYFAVQCFILASFVNV